MRQILEHQIEEALQQLNRLEHGMAQYETIHGVDAAKIAKELAASNLRLLKCLDNEKLNFGELKPYNERQSAYR